MAIVTVINNDILISVEKATYDNVECIKFNLPSVFTNLSGVIHRDGTNSLNQKRIGGYF